MDFYNLQVATRQYLTRESVKITFSIPHELRALFQFNAGQHIRLSMNGSIREYSLCSSPTDNDLSIAVKKNGRNDISNYLAEDLKEGDTLKVSEPIGGFGITPKPERKGAVVAFAAGSGITPILSITKYMLNTEPGVHFYLFYSNRTPDTMMFADELAILEQEYPDNFHLCHIYSQARVQGSFPKGRLDAAKVQLILEMILSTGNLEKIIACGPSTMVDMILEQAMKSGISTEDIHSESSHLPINQIEPSQMEFNPTEMTKITLTIDGITSHVLWDRSQPLLQSLLGAGFNVPYSCGKGQCGTCTSRLEQGKVRMVRNYVLTQSHLERGLILPCVAKADSSSIQLDYDRF